VHTTDSVRRPPAIFLAAAAAIVAVIVGVALVDGGAGTGWAAAGKRVAGLATSTPISHLELTPAQRVELTSLVDTPARAAAFRATLQAAFAGAAKAGAGPMPPARGTGLGTGAAAGNAAFSQGWDRNHWWVIMSYADAANGGIDAGIGACTAQLPGWLCAAFGTILRSWVAGHGATDDHGVWLTVYYWGRIDGGRW
jgi:hypothetical protein